jgi:tRNA pseudouridine55 synthase
MHGFLLIDKPAGLTSHDIVDRIRRLSGLRQVGHAGTLDPFATGLLVLGVGPTTKQLNTFLGQDKSYRATLRLGAVSATFDPEGPITETPPTIIPQLADIERSLVPFRGGYDQRAPLHSAKKIGGKKLYELARAGTATEDLRPVKQVLIPQLEIISFNYPELVLDATVSSGTYIRSLADDIGRVLGTGGYLTALRRTAVGSLRVEQAVTLERLNKENFSQHLHETLDMDPGR